MPKAQVPIEYIVEALIHGGNFWQVGLRAIYFAITMLMWMFGPIPMFISSAATVAVLYVLDVNNNYLYDFNESSDKQEERNKSVMRGFEQLGSNCGVQATPFSTTIFSAAVVS